MTDLTDKVIIITGAASGIGAATAERCKAQHAKVISTDNANDSSVLQLDVTDPVSIDACIENTIATYGKIDGLVNSAGINGIGPAHLITHDQWQRVIDVQLTGSFAMARAVLPHMLEKSSGAIVNISSIYGMSGGQGNVSYNTAKGGILQLTRSMAADYGTFGIRVNSVSPGYIETPLSEILKHADELRERFVAMHPLKRAGQPEEVAAAITFLLSEDASFISGANLPVDGGFSSSHMML